MSKKVAIAVKIIVGIGLLFGGVALLRSMPEAARYWRVLPISLYRRWLRPVRAWCRRLGEPYGGQKTSGR